MIIDQPLSLSGRLSGTRLLRRRGELATSRVRGPASMYNIVIRFCQQALFVATTLFSPDAHTDRQRECGIRILIADRVS
jgi:hypothetical protein